MLQAFLGDNRVGAIQLGSLTVDKIYLGDALVWTRAPMNVALRVGQFTLTGSDATLRKTNGGVSAATGHFTLTGFYIKDQIKFGTGQFTLTGKPMLNQRSVKLATGSFSLIGRAIVDPPVPHRYWRINASTALASGGTGTVNIAECEMASSYGGANLCVGGTPSASSNVGGRNPTAAFDGSFASTSFWAASAALPQWLMYDFGAGNAKVVKEVRIAQISGTTTTRALTNFTVEYSDDNVNWFVNGTFSRTVWTPANTFYAFQM